MEIKKLILQTLKGLEITAIEKIKIIGPEAASDDLDRIKDMVDELVCFWGLDEQMMDDYDDKIQNEIDKCKS
jgi:hypothetical protein